MHAVITYTVARIRKNLIITGNRIQ
jgi:hypothetical protein